MEGRYAEKVPTDSRQDAEVKFPGKLARPYTIFKSIKQHLNCDIQYKIEVVPKMALNKLPYINNASLQRFQFGFCPMFCPFAIWHLSLTHDG